MRLKTWQISVTIVCLLSGILFAVNMRSQKNIEYNATSSRNENLVKIIKTQEKNNRELENEINQIRQSLDNYQKFYSEGKGHMEKLQKDIEKAKRETGLTEVEGPGIIVTIDDKKHEAEQAIKSGDSNLQPFLIHDEDVHAIVNDLKVAGAEAISVNGLRIVSTSDIKCAGYLIQVSGTRLAAPYVIQGIGDPDKLEGQVRKGTYMVLEWSDFPAKITKEKAIRIQPYKGSFVFKNATIVKKDAAADTKKEVIQ